MVMHVALSRIESVHTLHTSHNAWLFLNMLSRLLALNMLHYFLLDGP